MLAHGRRASAARFLSPERMSAKKTKQINKLADLTPDAANVNKGTERGAYVIDWSLTELGAGRSILADADGRIIAGNKTLEAAADRQMPVRVVQTDGKELVVVQRTDLRLNGKGKERERARQMAIADNRASEVGYSADVEALLAHSQSGVDISAMYRPDEIDALIAGLTPEDTGGGESSDAEPQIDQAAELNKKWKVKAGDIWQIGDHRLHCADSDALAPEVFRDCETLFFDPEWDEMKKPEHQFASVLAFADGQRVGDIVNIFGAPAWLFAWDCVTSWYTPNRPLKRMKLCAWYGDVNTYDFDGHHYGEPLEAKTVTNTRGSYEFKPDPRGKHLSDIFQMPITKAHADGEHSHSKPLDWVMCLLANCTKGGIYDPFAGSGVSMVAAENLRRPSVAVEIEPNNCAVILERMSAAFPALSIARAPDSRSAGLNSRQVKTAASPA
jgi:hypothetical protein